MRCLACFRTLLIINFIELKSYSECGSIFGDKFRWDDDLSGVKVTELQNYNEEKKNLCEKKPLIYKLGPRLMYNEALKYCQNIGSALAVIKDESTWELINNQTFGK